MARFKFVKKASSSVAYKPIAPNPAAKLAIPPEMGAAPSKGNSLDDEQVAQQIQSQEMVQIMLHVAFGTLFYLRDLYPQSCFRDCSLKAFLKQNKVSYNHFIDENERVAVAREGSSPTSGSGGRGQPVKVLLRGQDQRLDAFLHLLETGIFDAIRKGWLQAVQVTVIVDKNNPQNVLESYTFTFKYKGSLGSLESRLASISLRESGYEANLDSLKTARVGLEMIVRRLIVLSALMPTFPRERCLGIHLIHTDSCPLEYRPPGFTDSSHDVMYFPSDENWHRLGQFCGSMDAGYHTIGLQVSSLRWTGPEPEGDDPAEIPADIGYAEAVRRESEIGIPEPLIKITPPPDHTAASSRQNSLPMVTYSTSAQSAAGVRRHPENKESSADVIITAKSSSDPGQKANGRGNQIPEQDSDYAYELLPSKIQEIEEKKRLGGAPGSADGHEKGSVHCHCDWEEEEAEMLQCHCCSTLQHPLCYGFSSLKDARLPNVHVCYYCLLEPNEKELCQSLKNVVLMRRALAIIQQEGFPNRQSDFSRKLHCNGQTTVAVTNLLKNKGLLQGTPGYKLKGFMATGRPKFTIPSGPQIQERIQKQTHPLLKIQHHYKQISSSSNLDSHQSVSRPLRPVTRAVASGSNAVLTNGDGTLSHPSNHTAPPGEEKDGRRTHRARYSDIAYEADSSQIPNLYDAETDGSVDNETQTTYNTRSGMKRRLAHSVPENVQQQNAGKVIVLKYQGTGNHVEPGPPAKRLKMTQLPEPIDVSADSTDDGETASNT